MKSALLTLLLIAAGQSYACDRINFALAVDHFNGGDYNENGPLLGCEAETYAFRYMKNSHNRDAFSATRRFTKDIGIELAAEAGITTGYKGYIADIGGVSPWALLSARIPVGRLSITGVYFFAGAGIALSWEL